jgi:hypothetical protein
MVCLSKWIGCAIVPHHLTTDARINLRPVGGGVYEAVVASGNRRVLCRAGWIEVAGVFGDAFVQARILKVSI